jgi:trk system potassium uptake protein
MGLQVIVIGLGRFGAACARELNALGHEVLAIDADETVVNEIAAEVTHAVQADASDEAALRALGAQQFQTAVVAMSGSVEASIFATMALKRLGVPFVIGKAGSSLHGAILEQIGADRVIYPEAEAGRDVAHTIRIPEIVDYIDLAPGFGVAKVAVPQRFIGKTLRDLDLGTRFKVSPIALVRGVAVTVNPHRDEMLGETDELLLVGNDDEVARLTSTAE